MHACSLLPRRQRSAVAVAARRWQRSGCKRTAGASMSKRRTTCTVASHWALTSPSVAPPPRRRGPTDLSSTPSSREVRLAGHVASRYPTVTCQLQTLHDRWSPNGRDYAIMRLCSSLLPSFGSGEVPCHAHLIIKSAPIAQPPLGGEAARGRDWVS